MPTVAEQLRAAREARNLTITQVAEITKIRTDHIRALEEGDFNVFVAPVYIRGFVRTYATLLKLDTPKVMAALDGELSRTEKFSEPPPLSNQPRGVLDYVMLQASRVDWRKALVGLAAVVAVVAIVGIWTALRRARAADPLAGLPPAVYRPATAPAATLPLTNAPAHRPEAPPVKPR